MTSNRIFKICVLASSVTLSVAGLGCSSSEDDSATPPGGGAGAGGASGAAGGTTTPPGGAAGVGGLIGGAGVAGEAIPAWGPGHNIPTAFVCRQDTDCRRYRLPFPACMTWSICETMTTKTCSATLIPPATCLPGQVLSCTAKGGANGVALCAANCSYDSTCTPCGETNMPCCPGAKGSWCNSGTCTQTDFPTGMCQ